MKRYRIKEITYKSGRKEYVVQKRVIANFDWSNPMFYFAYLIMFIIIIPIFDYHDEMSFCSEIEAKNLIKELDARKIDKTVVKTKIL